MNGVVVKGVRQRAVMQNPQLLIAFPVPLLGIC